MPNENTLDELKETLEWAKRELEKPPKEDIYRPKASKRYKSNPLKTAIIGTVLGITIGAATIGNYFLKRYFSSQPSVKPETAITSVQDDSLQKRVQELSSQNAKLRQKNAQYKTKIESFSSQLSEQKAEAERLRQEREQPSTQEVRRDDEQHEIRIQELSDEVERLRQERDQVVAAKEAAETERNQATERLSEYEAKLKQKEAEVERLKTTIKAERKKDLKEDGDLKELIEQNKVRPPTNMTTITQPSENSKIPYLEKLIQQGVIDKKIVDSPKPTIVRYIIQKEKEIYSSAKDKDSIEFYQRLFELYQAASELLPNRKDVQGKRTAFGMRLGKSYEKERNFRKALECYEQIPNPNKTLQLHIINLKVKAGDVDEALEQYKRLKQK